MKVQWQVTAANGHRGLLIRSSKTAYLVVFSIRRKPYVWKVTDVWKSDGRLHNITN
jgi:hypothetical protein